MFNYFAVLVALGCLGVLVAAVLGFIGDEGDNVGSGRKRVAAEEEDEYRGDYRSSIGIHTECSQRRKGNTGGDY